MTLVYELIFLVLVPASLFDLWQYRVPNALCFAALVISLIGHLDRISAGGISFWLAGIIIPFSVRTKERGISLFTEQTFPFFSDCDKKFFVIGEIVVLSRSNIPIISFFLTIFPVPT